MQVKKASLLLLLLVFTALPISAVSTCSADTNAPSPQLIGIRYNLLILKHLKDPCLVKLVEVIYSKGNVTKTLLSTTPYMVDYPGTTVLLPSPPFTLSVIYADTANNTATLTWTITALPYTLHALVTMVTKGAQAFVQILGPPQKPFLPRQYADPSFQTQVFTSLSVLAFLVGLVRFFLHKES